MTFQGHEGKVGSWILEVANNAIEYGAKNFDIEIPKVGTVLLHDNGNGIDKKTFSTLLGLIKGKDRIATFNRWNEGLKKILCLVSEMYVETKHQTDGFRAGIFKWRDGKTKEFTNTYDPTNLPDPLPEDDWETHIRHKDNIMKYPKGTSVRVKFMFNKEKKDANPQNMTKWIKTYYHLLMNNIIYDKIDFKIDGKQITNELTKYREGAMTFKTNIYGNRIQKEKFRVPIIIFQSDTPIPEEYRGVFIVVNGIRVEEFKMRMPTDLDDKLCIYFCADFFARLDIAEDRHGLVNRDKTGLLKGQVEKRFKNEARSVLNILIDDNKDEERIVDKQLTESTKRLVKMLNKEKWKKLLSIGSGIKKGKRKPPQCPECHSQNFTTWDKDDAYNICKDCGHMWEKNRWKRSCPICFSEDIDVEHTTKKIKCTCNKCGHKWESDKRTIRTKQLTTTIRDEYPPKGHFYDEVRYEHLGKQGDVIYINSGAPTLKRILESKNKAQKREHINRCLALLIAEIAAEQNELTKTEELKLFYEAYLELF